MKIKINKPSEKLEKTIAEAEGKATARTLSTYELDRICKTADEHFKDLGLSKKASVGAILHVCETIGCNAYGRRAYTAHSTYASVERFPSGWFLTSVARVEIAPSDKSAMVRYEITGAQKDIIFKKMLKENDLICG